MDRMTIDVLESPIASGSYSLVAAPTNATKIANVSLGLSNQHLLKALEFKHHSPS